MNDPLEPAGSAAIQYRRMIRSVLTNRANAFRPEAETGAALQVERGLAYAAVLIAPQSEHSLAPLDRMLQIADRASIDAVAVVDRAGHRRPVYRPLLVYAAAQALRDAGRGALEPRIEHSLNSWTRSIEAQLDPETLLGAPAEPVPASRGSDAVLEVWSALALYAAGRCRGHQPWIDSGARILRELALRQTPRGTFLLATPGDNPETHWYHELVILHAITSFALQERDAATLAAVARNADFHLVETQPDHATAQPWGLAAFVLNDSTRPLAEQVLHASQTLIDSGLSSILLADALYCLSCPKPSIPSC